MATNLVKQYMDWQNPNHPRANWAKDFRNITSADIGYGVPIFLDEIIGNTNVSLDIKCAMFTNPTKAPLYSRFKMQVTGWWAPISTYVPALRDSVKVDATTDYSFPTINFDYPTIKSAYDSRVSRFTEDTIGASKSLIVDIATGAGLPYIPTASIWSYLRMWPSGYNPVRFTGGVNTTVFPKGRNAIPLLMYYDILRNYIINNQDQTTFIRQRAFYSIPSTHTLNGQPGLGTSTSPIDSTVTRDSLDSMFANIRRRLMDYHQDEPVDISDILQYNSLYPPNKNVAWDNSLVGNDFINSIITFDDYHCGLWRDTYLNDFYTAYISDENVEYERNTAKITIDPSESLDGTLEFTMEELRIGTMLQNFVRSHIFDNGDFADYVDVEYGCKPPRMLSKPMFLGAISNYLTFSDVIATAQTGESGEILSNDSVGSRAAVGQGHMFTGKYKGKNKYGKYDRSFIKFHASEPGYLMLILTIKPEVAYFEGYDALFDKHSIFDLYRPSFAEIGYQDKCVRHADMLPFNGLLQNVHYYTISGGPNLIGSGRTTFENYDQTYGYEPYGFEYMGKPSIITGQMSEIGTYRHWTNGRSFHDWKDSAYDIYEVLHNEHRFTTTIRPEDYHYIFANTQNLDNFQFFFDFDYNCYQPVPHKILSFK